MQDIEVYKEYNGSVSLTNSSIPLPTFYNDVPHARAMILEHLKNGRTFSDSIFVGRFIAIQTSPIDFELFEACLLNVNNMVLLSEVIRNLDLVVISMVIEKYEGRFTPHSRLYFFYNKYFPVTKIKEYLEIYNLREVKFYIPEHINVTEKILNELDPECQLGVLYNISKKNRQQLSSDYINKLLFINVFTHGEFVEYIKKKLKEEGTI